MAHPEILNNTMEEGQQQIISKDQIGLWLFGGATILTFLLIIGFFIASLVQLQFLHGKILEGSQGDLRESIDILSLYIQDADAEEITAGRFQALVNLEAYALERRYHQANVLLMSRIWIRYLGFITGMILSLMGGAFILGKLREPSSKLAAEIGTGNFSFEGASPGMFLSGLGVILMLFTILINHKIDVTDRAVYINSVMLNSSKIVEDSDSPPELVYPDFSTQQNSETTE